MVIGRNGTNKSTLLRSIALGLAARTDASVMLAGQAALAQESVPGWHSNLEDARKLAESTGKPLFITFRCVR